MTFRFEVSDANGVHTTRDVAYELQLPMVASAVKFGGKAPSAAGVESKLGASLKVVMVPATVPDLRTLSVYKAVDAEGKSAAERRQFFLDATTGGSGVLLFSAAGKPAAAAGSGAYEFDVTIAPTLDSVGPIVFSFRYVTASGESIAMSAWNADAGEVFDDNAPMTLQLKSALTIVDVEEEPKTGDFSYGNVISFKFKVKDTASGVFVRAGKQAAANLFLVLRHDSGSGREFVSTREPARASGDYFVFEWNVSPNAVRGAGVLSIEAADADGKSVALQRGSAARFEKKVTIGGDLEVTSSHFSTGVPETYDDGVVVVAFSLSCKGVPLHGANLRAYVHEDGVASGGFRTAVSTDATGSNYTLSFLLPADAPGKVYTLDLYRDVDRQQAVEAAQAAAKKAGVAAPPSDEVAVPALFSIRAPYTPPARNLLPVRTESIVSFLLLVAFAWSLKTRLSFEYGKK